MKDPNVMVHDNCGGLVVEDADFIAGDGDADEIWWNYRCQRCKETFRYEDEWKGEDA